MQGGIQLRKSEGTQQVEGDELRREAPSSRVEYSPQDLQIVQEMSNKINNDLVSNFTRDLNDVGRLMPKMKEAVDKALKGEMTAELAGVIGGYEIWKDVAAAVIPGLNTIDLLLFLEDNKQLPVEFEPLAMNWEELNKAANYGLITGEEVDELFKQYCLEQMTRGNG